jgi:hypothetical protein
MKLLGIRQKLGLCQYDDPKLGLVAHTNNRGRPKEKSLLQGDETVESNISLIRQTLTFDKNSKLVLMISYATDEMIRATLMHPEVLFMGVIGSVNRQKRDFFLSIVHSGKDKCFPSNITVIPSGEKIWANTNI